MSGGRPFVEGARRKNASNRIAGDNNFVLAQGAGRTYRELFSPFTAMPSTATLFSVKIASPRDVAMEAAMACDVIREWNAAHAPVERKALLPLSDGVSACCDMLVAFLHPTPGAPMETMEMEIESYLTDGKPVFIYLSEARTAFGQAGATHEDAERCKSRYAGRAVVDSFKDEKEFRARFAQQLETALPRMPNLAPTTPPEPLPDTEPDSRRTAAAPAAASPSPAPRAEVSELALRLLFAACDDPEAYIGRLKDGATLKLQANGEQFVPSGDPAATARWEAAFQELVERKYIRDAGCHGRLFQISTEGFAYLKTHGKSPVGYIAELGSV